MKALVLAVLLALGTTSAVQAQDVLIYSNGFESAVGPEWSSTATEVTPIGARRFLGEFCSGSDSVSLSLSGLQLHATLTVVFDLFMIASVDGNCVTNLWGQHVGPDVWDLSIDGSSVLHTTFSNLDATPGWSENQAYPGSYPSGDYAPTTGAVERETLGFLWHDSVYHLTFTVPHSSESALIQFTGDFQEIPEHSGGVGVGEGWGLDNVQVSVASVPEPSSVLALLCGLSSIGGIALRKKTSK